MTYTAAYSLIRLDIKLELYLATRLIALLLRARVLQGDEWIFEGEECGDRHVKIMFALAAI